MFIRFYNKCVMCDKVYYEEDKVGCTYPSKTCPGCRKYYDRAKSVQYRLNEPVDYKYIRQLLMQNKCTYCGRELTWKEKEIEHKTPISKGGGNDNNNLCLSCPDCNGEKGDMTYSEYMAYRKKNPCNASNKKVLLNLLSQHTLLATEEHFEVGIENRKLKTPITKNKIIKDDNGKMIGLRKVIIDTEPVSVKIKVSETHLTEWGEVYNAVCKLFGKELLTEQTESEVIGEIPPAS